MINSKKKGARGEREACKFLNRYGYHAVRGMQYQGSPDSPDIVCPDLDFHVEVKRVNRFQIYKALEQAKGDCGDKIPLVLHRRDRGEWIVVLRAKDFFEYIQNA